MKQPYLVILLVSLTLTACSRVVPVEEIRPQSSEGTNGSAPQVEFDAHSDWPGWWGANRDGTSPEMDLLTSWSATENVIWSTPVRGRGHSSPCVFGNRIFLTSAYDEAEQQKIVGFDRESGQMLWSTLAHQGNFMRAHEKNTHASATPASDGERVFAVFLNDGGLWVTATDLEGKILWQTMAGPFGSEHGYGSSPVIHKSLVIVLGDNLTGCFVAGLDRTTGDIVWRTARKTSGRHGSYGTPIVASVAGRDQLLVSGMSEVASYNPLTGELDWTCAGPAEVTGNAICAAQKLIFASGGYPEKELLAIRADGIGDVTESHVVWKATKGVTYVPSPLYHNGRLFVVNDEGIATCFDAATGEVRKTRRLGGDFSASPILADGHLFIPDEEGTTFVLQADDTLEVVARNDLGGGGFASLAIGGGQFYIRTLDNLYCIGRPLMGR